MYKICKTPKSEARQIEFQDTLLKMLQKQKLKNITIASLCREMGLSRKTFYKYFDTIEDVLHIIIDKELRSGFLLLEIGTQICEFFYFWKKNKWLLDILEENKISQILVDRAYNNNFLNIKESEDYDIQYMKKTVWISSMITVLILWNQGGMKQEPEEMESLVYDMFGAKQQNS